MKDHPLLTRAFLSAVFLIFLFNESFSQCGTAPSSGSTAISLANQIVNSYYPGTGNPVIGATTLTVGTMNPLGSATDLSSGDMVLIIQMQGADFNSGNSDAYGNGVAGGNASGYLTSNLMAGYYEYNIVSSYNNGSGVVNFLYSLANNYYTRTYTASTGIRTYQVIRVPRYYDLTIDAGASITAPTWNGSTGGIVVLEAANTITLNGSVTANSLGFRGGGGKDFDGNVATTVTNTDYRWASPIAIPANVTGGAKGEGIAGTPIYILTNGATSTTPGSVEGYIDGSMGRGAPGNAGGGGTDGDPTRNRFNPGGGGGGNGGAGGKGGSGWDNGAGNPTTYPTGGYGGAAFAQASLQRLVLGGGGGAGTANNSSAATEYLSSGACGGGIVIMRAKSYSGNGTVTANGATANNVAPPGGTDAAGGGGAGGTIVVVTNQAGSVGTHTITASANGGKGGDMTTHYAHGPGGGGGGGVVITNVIPSGSITVTAGVNGLTRSTSSSGPVDNIYGSAPGSVGIKSILTSYTGFQNANNGSSQCGVLPITLRLWNGVYKNNSTSLSWQTDAGTNFSHFVIEHSTDGVHYTSLGQVAAATATSSTLQYAFVDAMPANGLNYYRLKMVDQDGQYRYSGVITIRTAVKDFHVSVSPNPFTDHVVITIDSKIDETVHLRMFNSDGKLVWRKTTLVAAGSNAQYFNDLQSLPSGVYIIKVNKKSNVAEIKLVKQ